MSHTDRGCIKRVCCGTLCAVLCARVLPGAHAQAGLPAAAPRADSMRVSESDSAVAQPMPAGITANDTAETDSASAPVSDSDSTRLQRAAGDTVEYDADLIEYDVNTKILLLTGNGVVHYREMVLYADTIHYVIEEKSFLATGHPMLIDEGDTVVGTSMFYDLETRRGRVSVASATSGDTRYNGEFIAKSDSNVYYIEDGDYSSCAVVDSPHYTFYGRYIKVEPGERAISRPIILNIADAPVASLPYYILPLQRGRRSGWLRPRWGGNPAFGGYLENVGYYWAPNDYMDYSLAGKVTEFQDWVLTAAGNYALRYWLNGHVSGRWTQTGDYRARTQRWSVNFAHNQNLLPDQSLTLSGGGNVVSDKQFYRDFSEDTTELLNQNISANLSLNKRIKKINASAALTWRRSHNLKTNDVDEDLPSVSFNLPSRPLIPQRDESLRGGGAKDREPKWYNKIYYSYNIRGLQKRAFNVDSAREHHQIHRGAHHSFSLNSPQKVLKYLTVTPNFTIGQSAFDAYIDTNAITRTRREIVRDTVTQVSPGERVIDTVPGIIARGYVVERDTTVAYTAYDTTRWYDDSYDLSDAQTYSWNTGVRMSTNLYGMFPIRVFNFAGMRHTLSPSVGYTFYPPKELERRFPQFGIPYDAAAKGRQSIRFSLGNLFQGKVVKPPKSADEEPQEKKFSIVNGSVSASYDFTDLGRDSGWDGRWSNLTAGANTAYKILNVSYNATFALYDEDENLIPPGLMRYTVTLRPSALGARGTLWGGDKLVLEGLHDPESVLYEAAGDQSWRVGFSPSYSFTRGRESLDDEFETKKDYHLSSSLSLSPTRRWSLSTSTYYNFITNRFEGLSFAFRADLECWDLRFDWHPTGWNRGSFWFVVGIKRHRDIKWEHRDH